MHWFAYANVQCAWHDASCRPLQDVIDTSGAKCGVEGLVVGGWLIRIDCNIALAAMECWWQQQEQQCDGVTGEHVSWVSFRTQRTAIPVEHWLQHQSSNPCLLTTHPGLGAMHAGADCALTTCVHCCTAAMVRCCTAEDDARRLLVLLHYVRCCTAALIIDTAVLCTAEDDERRLLVLLRDVY